MMADPIPRKSPVDARITLIGTPMPVVRVAMEAISKSGDRVNNGSVAN